MAIDKLILHLLQNNPMDFVLFQGRPLAKKQKRSPNRTPRISFLPLSNQFSRTPEYKWSFPEVRIDTIELQNSISLNKFI
jgi:hypothetical protein